MKSYTPAPDSVVERTTALMQKFHRELVAARVKVDVIMMEDDSEGEGPALTLGGYACLAVVRKLSVKDRAMGRGDAEIVIDKARWESELSHKNQEALLDHELQHLEVATANGATKIDSAGRPVLKMRKHDRQFGWFDTIARRWGEDSNEVRQAREFMDEAGQVYFEFAKKEVAA